MRAPAGVVAPVIGILLAAGRGRRFDPTGGQDKLLQALPDGSMVALRAAQNLLAATPCVLAVLRPGALELARTLAGAGCEVVFCADADTGMGASLACGVTSKPDAGGWLIALADMPQVACATMRALTDAIHAGARIAVPVSQDRRGNPVAFGHSLGPALMACSGDQGARALLSEFPVTVVTVDDPGIWHDIDIPADLS